MPLKTTGDVEDAKAIKRQWPVESMNAVVA
jgi:hypothetical protein